MLTMLFFLTIYYIEFYCRFGTSVCPDAFEYIWMYTIVFIPVFLLSLLTYWTKDEVFRAWFSFARWWVPVIIGVTLWMEYEGSGGWVDLSFLFIGPFYYILIAGSLLKIIDTYLSLRWQEQKEETKLKKLKFFILWAYWVVFLPVALFLLWLLFAILF